MSASARADRQIPLLHIHFSNRIEKLADALAEEFARAPPADPLAPETVVIGHAGMDEWLKRGLAARLGITANLDFSQPAAFVWRMLRARDPGLPTHSPLDRGPLVWRLYAALGAGAQAAETARYLAAGDELSRFELAAALATVFEQYQIYRADTIFEWEAGKSAGGSASWQAALWRRVAGAATPNPARLYRSFAKHADELPANALPARVSVFGVSALAPMYLALLAAIADSRDVHLYVPNPSRAYWGDIESEKRLARWRLTQPERAEYATSGHPLLAALGTQSRDFIELLHGIERAVTEEHFAQPRGESLLARLQADMLDLREALECPCKADDSVLIHACHSRRREVEVLHDALLAAFERGPDLGPEDILVMAPNMDDYAAHVAAVFGAAPDERHIPWSLAEQSVQGEHPLATALLTLLALPDSRLKASEVLGLLELPAVAARLGLDEAALENLRRWIKETGIRWGWNGSHRAALGLPAEVAFTWRFGLDRLLAGYALAPDDERTWEEIAPWTALEGQSARALGPLCAFVGQLERWREALAEPRPLAAWVAAIRELLALFLPVTRDGIAAVERLRKAANDLESEAELSGFDGDVPRAVAHAALAARLAVPHHPRPFLSGRVTFCALAPMRSIPAKIVWLLGMSEADFPRHGHAPTFDLIAAHPRRGDRARRAEDRALFLDALLGARSAFHASYIGRGERDDEERPASVVVNRLVDVLERMGAQRGAIVVEHPLQPFSPRYRPEPLRAASFAKEWLFEPKRTAPTRPFAATPRSAETPEAIALADLIRGLCNPARRYLNALGVASHRLDEPAKDEEPLALDGLEQWRLKDALLARWLATGAKFDPESLRDECAARGLLPPGEAGRLVFADCADQCRMVARTVLELVQGKRLQKRKVDLSLGRWRVHGTIADVYAGAGLIHARAGGLRAKDRLAIWIEHLALAACADAPIESRFIGVEKRALAELRLSEVRDPATALERLCAYYAKSAREPLPLLPELSFEFARRALEADTRTALADARSKWRKWNEGNPHIRIAGAEEFALVFRGADEPLGREFESLAQAVFGSLARMDAAP
jgi:exodeoxyribonuclease V gamma subunit